MKIVLTLFLLSFYLYGQRDTTFISLKGFEDSTGTTQLFISSKSSKICLYNLGINKYVDSTLYNYLVFSVETGRFKHITRGFKNYYPAENHIQYSLLNDIEFFENDPSKYIYTINSLGIDPDGRINRYNLGEVFGILGSWTDLFISPRNHNTVYATAMGWILISQDKGVNWDTFILNNRYNNDDFVQYISISPFNQSIIYGVNLYNRLVKSNDSGKTFIEVGNYVYWNKDSRLFFDIDQKHIYSLTNSFFINELDIQIPSNIIISDSNGNAGSWNEIFTSDNNLEFCIDHSVSGNIFIARGNEILESYDYGKIIQKKVELPHHAHGLYKKPRGNLFALTVNEIMRIGEDTVETLLSKPIEHSFSYFPIKVGNKWFYSEKGVSYDIEPLPFEFYYNIEVTKDTIDIRGDRLFLFEGDFSDINYWIRIDSLTGKIYRRDNLDGNEQIYCDLIASEGDNTEVYNGIITDTEDSDTLIWNEYRYMKKVELLALYTYGLHFVQGLGIVKKLNSFDFGHSTTTLLGCVIDNTLYGDTTVASVENYDNTIPSTFRLLQNYPNPFNPSTTIEYSIPHQFTDRVKSEMLAQTMSGSKVKLIVYDNLGRVISVLVNEIQKPGLYEVEFNGSSLSSGIYYFQLSFGNFSETKKMILIK